MIYHLFIRREKFDSLEFWDLFAGKADRIIVRAQSEERARQVARYVSREDIWLDEEKTSCQFVPPDEDIDILLAMEFVPDEPK